MRPGHPAAMHAVFHAPANAVMRFGAFGPRRPLANHAEEHPRDDESARATEIPGLATLVLERHAQFWCERKHAPVPVLRRARIESDFDQNHIREASDLDRVKILAVSKKLPPDVLEYFRQQGAEGGRIGGKRALQTMTAEQRAARARKASKAAVEAKKAKGKG